MSAAQKIQQHPVFIQAQKKALHLQGQLDKELTNYPVFLNLEQRTQVPKTYIFVGGIVFLTFLHLINAFASIVSNLVGFALPAYFSFLAIESPATNDDVQWLTYWVIFGSLNFVENVAVGALLHYIPWYFTLKSIFIVWLQLPATRGAQTMYLRFFRPVLSNFISQSRAVAPTTSTNAEPHHD